MVAVDSPLARFTGSLHLFSGGSEWEIANETDLASAAIALGAEAVKPWSEQEIVLARKLRDLRPFNQRSVARLREMILSGLDPLGDAFCALRTAKTRRASGATYTPAPIVQAMTDWASSRKEPSRVVDPGTGSGRFLMKAGKAFPSASLVGIDADPLAALMARANLAVAGFADRSCILVNDYRRFAGKSEGPTLYIGNPPYVRHHDIASRWKKWFSEEAAKQDYKASKLAGLHVHFMLATALYARPGDFGAFITAAEWLDVNYGALVRSLMLKELGGQSITVIEPTAQPFPDAATTAVIATFEVASRPAAISFRRVDCLRNLEGLQEGQEISRERLQSQARWSCLTKPPSEALEGFVELGELCRVHRGQVTGRNSLWIAGKHSESLPDSVLFPAVTRAREILAASGLLDDSSKLRRVIDLPPDLSALAAEEREAVEAFLERALTMGADAGYVASHRRAWWAVGLRAPAPILATYMARRPPGFAINRACVRHINIAHGLYPRQTLSLRAQESLVRFLQESVSQMSGRTYAGGLTKFEPREMERLLVPGLDLLEDEAAP